MKDRIILRIKRWLHYRGFIIERIPNENKLDEQLNQVDEAGKRHILKRLTTNMMVADNHKAYDSLLKKYVPEWRWANSHTEFVNSGLGEYSFNTYRKVHIEGTWLFEKIYFNNTSDLARIEWFYEKVYPLLIKSINVTKLHRLIKGDIFTIVYFEYVKLSPLKEPDANERSFYYSKILLQISTSQEIHEICRSSPNFLKDYRLHFGYKRNIGFAAKAMERLSKGKVSPKIIEEVVDRQPLILTHGDIQRTNIYADNYLIDWDSFGFFPMGYESACILYERRDIVCLSQLDDLLTENYRPIVDHNIWVEYQLSCFYFYFIFTSLRDKTPQTVALERDIIDRIECLYAIARQRIDKTNVDSPSWKEKEILNFGRVR